MMKKYAKETWVGLFMTIGVLCVVYLAVRLGDVALFGEATYPLSARFSAVSALREGNPVTMMGIDIGKVDAIEIDQERRQAVVYFRIDKDIEVYSGEDITIASQTELAADRAAVRTRLMTDTGEIAMDYRLVQRNGEWKVYDLVVENVSLARNYRSQFESLLRNNSPDQLLETLQQKIEQNR